MSKCDIALYGLGVMGSSLAKNMISKGFKVAAYSKADSERARFEVKGMEDHYVVCESAADMVAQLKKPAVVFLMVTAGAPVDMVLEELSPLLEQGDVVIDGGNSHYTDTQRRCIAMTEKGIHFMGVGVSGGELGALYGPSLMPGGSEEGWQACSEVLTAIAASHDGVPCCAYVGKQGAGHYVKMVHNGIEYGILELFAEAYAILKNRYGYSADRILEVFEGWKESRLDSYILDISILALKKKDDDGLPLIEKILDVAGQKGTGKWTVEDEVLRGAYTPVINEALFARNVSADKALRVEGEQVLPAGSIAASENTHANKGICEMTDQLRDALLAAIILTYAQGMALIERASAENEWNIALDVITDLWREGCIIRSALLSEIKAALREDRKNIMFTETFAYTAALIPALRNIASEVVLSGTYAPCFAAAVNYYDSLRAANMPVAFVQALRDCFGAHTYARIDKEGMFHTQWTE